jgi:hypothetical protein
VDDPHARVGRDELVRVPLDQAGLGTPARLAHSLGVMGQEEREQVGVGLRTRRELTPDPALVGLEEGDVLVRQQRRQASVAVVRVAQ